MKKITVIDPNINEKNQEDLGKKRVCAYCRVSSMHMEQQNSFESQVSYYTKYINSNPAWESIGIYADYGITGTKKEKRPEFMRLISDCENRFQIAKGLEADGIKTVTGLEYWHPGTIDKMLSNEKFCGDACMQKNYKLHDAIIKAINKVVENSGDFIETFRENVIRVIGNYSTQGISTEYDAQI